MPGAFKTYKETGSGKFGIKVTYYGDKQSEIKWFVIEERRDQIFRKLTNNPNVLIVHKLEG